LDELRPRKGRVLCGRLGARSIRKEPAESSLTTTLPTGRVAGIELGIQNLPADGRGEVREKKSLKRVRRNGEE